jgi:hypothetical protein
MSEDREMKVPGQTDEADVEAHKQHPMNDGFEPDQDRSKRENDEPDVEAHKQHPAARP